MTEKVRFSLGRKLIYGQVVLVFLIMLIYTLFSYEFSLSKLRNSSVQRIESLSKLIAGECKSALQFLDVDAASRTLASLEADEEVMAARVYAADGSLFASYSRPGFTDSQFPTRKVGKTEVQDRYVFASGDIQDGGKHIGSVVIQAEMIHYEDAVEDAITASLIMLLAGLLVAVLLAGLFQRVITAPILRLVGTIDRVASERDYSVRIGEGPDDEIGVLYHRFDELLGRIANDEEELNEAFTSLQKSESLLREAQKIGEIGSWELSLKDHSIYWSDQVYEILGIEYSFPDERLFNDRLHPDDREWVLSTFKEAIEKKQAMSLEYRIVTPAGETKYLYDQGHEYRNDAGEVVMLIGTMQDITRRKLVELELKKHQNDLEKLVAERTEQLHITSEAVTQSPVSVVVADRNWQVEYVNRRFLDVTGFEESELMGQTLDLIQQGVGMDEVAKTIQETLARRSIWKGDLENHRKNGEAYWEQVSISPIIDDEGDVSHYVCVREDITYRKKLEKSLKEAVEVANEATRAKGEFLANMSHEIRTPLNAITGLVYLLDGTPLSLRQKDYLRKMNVSARSLLQIINDILDFSKIEAGKLEIENISFDLRQVMEDLTGILQTFSEGKDIEIVVTINPDVPSHLVGDPLRLEQVLLNLASNAVKFTEKGEIVVQAALVEANGDNIVVEFDVRDTGIGMTEEQMDRLFQPFSQADGSTTRKYGGTGLGLAICNNLVTAMGGSIHVESNVNEGSRFAFTVPYKVQHRPVKEHVPSIDLRGMRVLVVDDNVIARENLQHILESFSFQVDVAATGKMAVGMVQEAAKSHAYELVLMDWKMPGMDGIETALAIRESLDSKESPTVIMVTAFGREEVIRRAEEAGLDGYLVKPVSPSTLFDKIMEVFGKDVKDKPAPSKSTGQLFPKLRGRHVLLAEDNEINRLVACELLEREGLVVTVANNGTEALDALKKQTFDCVLMDIQMPVMGGIEATREIRANPEYKNLPVIAMTADAMSGDRERFLSAGMNDHIPKPIDANQLFSVLVSWIFREDARRSKQGTAMESQANRASADPERKKSIDKEMGIRQVGGNRSLYRNILGKFKESYGSFMEDYKEARKSGADEECLRMVHTLKGLSGSLGATGLQAAAARLNEALRNKEDPIPEELTEAVAEELKRVIQDLDELIAGGEEV